MNYGTGVVPYDIRSVCYLGGTAGDLVEKTRESREREREQARHEFRKSRVLFHGCLILTIHSVSYIEVGGLS